MKKVFLSIIFGLTACFLTACGGGDDVEQEPTPAEEEEIRTEDIVEVDEGNGDIEADNTDGMNETDGTGESLSKEEELEQKIKAEPGIESVRVVFEEGDDGQQVSVDIVLAGDQEEPADELADKYAEMIKADYPDHTVDIIIVRDGTQLTHKTYS